MINERDVSHGTIKESQRRNNGVMGGISCKRATRRNKRHSETATAHRRSKTNTAIKLNDKPSQRRADGVRIVLRPRAGQIECKGKILVYVDLLISTIGISTTSDRNTYIVKALPKRNF